MIEINAFMLLNGRDNVTIVCLRLFWASAMMLRRETAHSKQEHKQNLDNQK